MDEPLSRSIIHPRTTVGLLKDIRHHQETTVLHVTHSQWEADQTGRVPVAPPKTAESGGGMKRPNEHCCHLLDEERAIYEWQMWGCPISARRAQRQAQIRQRCYFANRRRRRGWSPMNSQPLEWDWLIPAMPVI